MLTRWRALRSRPTAGAAILEVAAAWGIAAMVILAVVVAVRGADIGAFTSRVLCTVKSSVDAGGGSCAGSTGGEQTPPPETFDPKPTKCKISERSEKVSSEIKIAFIKFGENAGFVQTTYSDGTVTYTATNGASLGATGGFGGKLEIGELERGAKVDFGGGFKVDYGSTWVFKDQAEADSMKDQLDEYLLQQEMLRHDTYGGYAIGTWITGGFVDPPKPPSQNVTSFTVEGDVSGQVGLSLPFDPADKNLPDDQKSGVPNLKLAEAGIKFGGSQKWTQISDADSGNTTWTTTGETFIEGSAALGPLAGELKGVQGSSLAITRNDKGEIVKVALVTTREGKATGSVNSGQPDLGGNASQSGSASSLTVTTASLDVTTAAQRDLVNQWLAAQATGEGAVSPETYRPDRLVAGDPFQNLMYTNATVSNVEYSNVTDKAGFALEVKVGVAFGVDFNLETTDSRATAATYLGVPGADGVRPPVDFPECVA